MSFSSPKYEAPEQVAPTVAMTPPEPEEVATAPKMTKNTVDREAALSKSKGTSALRIKLNLGGMNSTGTGNGAIL